MNKACRTALKGCTRKKMKTPTLSLAALLIAITSFSFAAHHPKIDAELEGKNPDTEPISKSELAGFVRKVLVIAGALAN